MKNIKQLFEALGDQLVKLAEGNAVVANPITVGERAVIPLCELSIGFGGGGASAEAGGDSGEQEGKASGLGEGGGGGGGATAKPVAVIIVDSGKARIQRID